MFTTPADHVWGGGMWAEEPLAGVIASGMTSTIDGDGNTAALAAMDSNINTGMQDHQAAKLCADLTAHGKADWYLPAVDELLVLYTNRVAIGGFDTAGEAYWSSTETNVENARMVRFNTGMSPSGMKTQHLLFRCVRQT